MIQPISSNNINFNGNLNFKPNPASGKTLEEIYSLIDEPERDVFVSHNDDLKEYIEEKTPEDANFTAVLGEDDWYPNNSALKYGKCVTLDIYDDGSEAKEPVFSNQFVVRHKDGSMWYTGDAFAKRLAAFLNDAKGTVMRSYNLRIAQEDAAARKRRG